MDFWENSSTVVKAAIVGIAALVFLILISLIANLGGQQPPAGAPEELTPVSTVTVEAPTVQPPTAVPGDPTVTATNTVNVRGGPGTNYPTVGMLLAGQTATAIGRNADSSWWAIDFPGQPSGQGWVSADFVTAANTENSPVISAPPVPTPTQGPPVAITAWRGEYFSNRNLQGEPVVVRNDERIQFNWANQPPAEGMPATNWSARWTISRNLPAGTYRFTIWVDDGVRLFVDDQLIIDAWEAGPARNFTADVNLAAGAHNARVEYFQGDGDAIMQLGISYVEGYPDWRAEYFSNLTLSEPATVIRNETEINHDWGAAAPASGVPADNWSARWTRSYDLPAGEYTIAADVQGGLRFWLNDRLLIDSWNEQSARQLSADTGPLNAGRYTMRVEYVKTTGNGRLVITGSETDGDPIPPRAVIQGPSRGQVGEAVTFSAAGSEVAAGSHISQVSWDFGDGTTGRGNAVEHTYTEPGIYNVALMLVDDKGLSDETAQQIRIMAADATPEPPSPPVAVIDAPAQGQVGQPVTFYAGNSQSVNPLISYAWNFGDGTVADGVSVQKRYDAAGAFTVNLTVIDDQGLRSDAQHQITVQDGAATAVPTPAPTEEPEPTAEPTAEPEPTTEPTAEPEPTDEPGDGAETPPDSPVIVTVDGTPVQPQVVDGVPTLEVGANQIIEVDASGPAASNPDLAFTWDMGDGSAPLTGAVVQHSYGEPGTYTVQVDVDNGQETATTVWQVLVTE